MSATFTESDINQMLKDCIANLMQRGTETDLINADTNLFDIGIDSMNMTELLLQIEERFRLTLAPEELSADLFTRFGRLVTFVQHKLPHV